MPRRRSRIVMVIGGIAITMLSVLTIAAAETTTINPAGDKLLIDSSNVSFGLGSGTVKCELMQTDGSIPSPAASSMSLHAPWLANLSGSQTCESTGLSGATFTVETEGAWTLNAISATSASIALPHSWSLFLKDNSARCTITVASTGATISGTWTSGSGHYQEETPLLLGKWSKLVFTDTSIPVEHTGTECVVPFSEVTSITFSANLIINDATSMGSNVSLK
jgi:hypothetical protein